MKTKQKSLHRFLTAVLAVVMLLSCSAITVFAAGNDSDTKEAIYLGVPSEIADGVYYADVNMKNATNPSKQYSMGNAALRGSESYKSKQPTDTDYRPIVIVKDGKATALLEFMPMGYIGMYGFMMELEGVYPGSFTRYGSPNAKDENTVFTPTRTLTYQKTVDGKIVYDGYNDPDSDYKFSGNKLRPAGFGKEEEYLDIVDKYYSHLLALDVTPVMVKNDGEEVPTAAADYTGDHAAFCHVFVPVMFDISASSGDQYARMQVDWTSLERIEEPENNVQYMLYKASQTSTDGCSAASVSAFESAYAEVRAALENVWSKQHLDLSGSGFTAQPVLDLKTYTEAEQVAMAQKLKVAIDALSGADKKALDAKIAEVKGYKEADYTPASFSTFRSALRAAQLVSRDEDATQEKVDKALATLETAVGNLVKNTDAEKYKILYSQAEALDSADYTKESWAAFEKVWEGKKNTKDISKLPAFMQSATVKSLESAIDALVEKPTLDVDATALADGKYTLKAYMYKAAQPETYSMSNNAINHNVWLEVKDGQYILTVQFVGMSIYNKFGYLKQLKYYDAGYTYDSTGQPVGQLKDVEVLSTQKTRSGEDVIDQYNSAGDLYPALVRFPLVDKASGEYVPLQVFVPVMDSIAAGLGTQNALMELDWSKLRADDGSVQPMEPPVQSPALKATDEKTGISVDADAGVFDEDTKLVTEKIESGTLYDTTASRLSDIGEKFTLFDIGFKDYAGEYVLPNGSFRIRIPVPAGYDTEKVKIYRINDDEDNIGPKTLMGSVTIKDGYMETLVLQRGAKPFHYAVVEVGSKLPVPGDFTALNNKVAEAKELLAQNGDMYTADSVKNVNDAVAYAESLSSQAEQPAVDEALERLNNALAALTYRDADYSAVDAAIAAIPEDLSQYTDESVAAVEAAKAAVVRGKNITEQSEVDAMAKAINDAVAKLEKKNVGGLDFKNLPDGVYSVQFTMVKMNRNDLSMSNDAVNHIAKLTVKDGNYTLTVNFKGLHYLNRFGYLAKLSYYDNGYTYGEYGSVIGTLKIADVLSIQKNADGSDVTDEFNVPGGIAEGMKYPQTISFPLVDTAKADADGYVPLHVFVPVMEDISEGSGDQDVLMKLDVSSLKETTEDDPAFEPEKPEELSPAVDITDEETGVRVRADKGVFPEGVVLVVKEITSGDDYTSALSALADISKNFKLYDIRFVDKNGNEVTPNGTFTIICPVPSEYDNSRIAVYRINADGSKTLVNGASDSDGYAVIVKNSGSYALAEKDGASDDNTNDNNNPDTGDSSNLVLWTLLMTVSAALLVLIVAKKRKFGKGE